jgi:DNA-binding response OmpR family regulator
VPDKVLIIDDDFAITKALVVRLSALGFQVRVANDGLTGQSAAAEFMPDVILLDIRMPDLTGFEVCRWLKSQPALALTPVIFLSANITDDNRREAIDAGAAAFLTKPYEASKVVAEIKTQIANLGNTKERNLADAAT